jgi:hypothetical protein
LNLIPFRGFLVFIFLLILAGPGMAQTVPFTEVIIDDALAGDCKMVGDIDGDGQGTACQKQGVSTGGIHNGVVADIGNDGDWDIYGANWTGYPPVRLWSSQLAPQLKAYLPLLAH